MKTSLALLLLAFASQADAGCSADLPLKGALTVTSCERGTRDCIPASQAVYDYTEAIKNDPEVFSIGIQASPWHFYDGDMRIMEFREIVAGIQAARKPEVRSIWLVASWTDVAPNAKTKSLAHRLSEAMNGFPVRGMDGFLWLSKDGKTRTTHQAFTLTGGSAVYAIKRGEDVMVALAAGWPALFEEHYINKGDAEGLMRAGAGWEIYMLCPEHALATFEAAAKLGNPVAAYNAAIMRLERKTADDAKAAEALLSQASAAGDKKAQARLKELKGEH